MHVSLDDGKTWPISKVIDPGGAGYSDIYPGADGSLFCRYEHGGSMADNTLMTVVKLEQDWLLGDRTQVHRAPVAEGRV